MCRRLFADTSDASSSVSVTPRFANRAADGAERQQRSSSSESRGSWLKPRIFLTGDAATERLQTPGALAGGAGSALAAGTAAALFPYDVGKLLQATNSVSLTASTKTETQGIVSTCHLHSAPLRTSLASTGRALLSTSSWSGARVGEKHDIANFLSRHRA